MGIHIERLMEILLGRAMGRPMEIVMGRPMGRPMSRPMGRPIEIPMGRPMEISHGTSHGTSHETSHGNSHEMSHGMSHGTSHGNSPGMSGSQGAPVEHAVSAVRVAYKSQLEWQKHRQGQEDTEGRCCLTRCYPAKQGWQILEVPKSCIFAVLDNLAETLFQQGL